jgi:hypothetical protein
MTQLLLAPSYGFPNKPLLCQAPAYWFPAHPLLCYTPSHGFPYMVFLLANSSRWIKHTSIIFGVCLSDLIREREKIEREEKGTTVFVEEKFNFQIGFSQRKKDWFEKKSSTKLFLFLIQIKKVQNTSTFFLGNNPNSGHKLIKFGFFRK